MIFETPKDLIQLVKSAYTKRTKKWNDSTES